MNNPLDGEFQRQIEQVILEKTGSPASIQSRQPTSGGCIHSAETIVLVDGRSFFVKSNRSSSEMFSCEADGLKALSRAAAKSSNLDRTSKSAIQVPTVVGRSTTDSGMGLLVLEYVETGHKGGDFFEVFGRSLAELHRQARSDRYGFEFDNFIGSTPQPNRWSSSWIEFWAEQRLGFQLRLAHDHGLTDASFTKQCNQLISDLDHWLAGPGEPPSLIHGDLWSGNYLVNLDGQPVLIDPAVYYGVREAEFGMTTLFGGFPTKFYDAYNEAWPLADGWQRRSEIYKLYHLLNHLNLFGSSYRAGCLDVLKRFA